jgi:hypothetical protein
MDMHERPAPREAPMPFKIMPPVAPKADEWLDGWAAGHASATSREPSVIFRRAYARGIRRGVTLAAQRSFVSTGVLMTISFIAGALAIAGIR